MVSVGLFWWEFNVRASTVLGVVGAGGIGPSGAGKATLFRGVTGLPRPDGGRVRIDGRDIWQSATDLRVARRATALIFQQFNLIRRLTALENVLVGRLAHVPTWRVVL